MKISLVIPTRERSQYLRHSLATVTSIDDPDIEIVVSDNASNDDTRDVAQDCADPRLRYVNTGARLSMRQNFEFALRQSTGDYVIMFGDDDGMVPGQFAFLRQILEQELPDTLSWDFLTFGWPTKGFGTKLGGVRLMRETCFGDLRAIDAANRLQELERGHRDMSRPLPVLYHGCMSRAYLDRLKGAVGDYFKSMSPDLYISFRALQHGGNFWHLHHPLSINGFSPASTGGAMQSLGGKNDGITDQRFLTEIRLDDMQDVIPVTKSMALAFLGTLQTVHARHPDDPIAPDFQSWYTLALNDQQKKDPVTAAEIAASLDAHAAQFGTQDALQAARCAGPPSAARRARTALRRNLAKLHSFRVCTEIDGINTISTAAQTVDALLGTDLAAVMAGDLSRKTAWTRAKTRSRDFKKQL